MNTELSVTAGNFARRLLSDGAALKIIGVFSSALYAARGDEILLIHGSFYGSVPFGIAVPDVRAFLAAANAEVDGELLLSPETITVCGRTFRISFKVTPEAALPVFSGKPDMARIAAVEAYVRAHGSPMGILQYLADNRGGAADSVRALCAGFDRDAAVRLIGLGRGLTPSGDDFLCGFFTTLAALGNCTGDAELCRRAVLDNLTRTSAISGAYVKDALAGKYFSIYDAVLRAVCGDEPFEPLCDFALQMGASSGTDTLIGAITAARLYAKPLSLGN